MYIMSLYYSFKITFTQFFLFYFFLNYFNILNTFYNCTTDKTSFQNWNQWISKSNWIYSLIFLFHFHWLLLFQCMSVATKKRKYTKYIFCITERGRIEKLFSLATFFFISIHSKHTFPSCHLVSLII